MAESEGFEPPEGCPSTVFKTAAFDHSASSPVFDYSIVMPEMACHFQLSQAATPLYSGLPALHPCGAAHCVRVLICSRQISRPLSQLSSLRLFNCNAENGLPFSAISSGDFI
jgi:hypothetical protein